MKSILLVDHFDSFSQILAAEVRKLEHDVLVVRSSLSATELGELADERDAVVLSPGPGRPADVPSTLALCRHVEARVPVLGICLGHQCLAEVAGSPTRSAPRPVHGKAERLEHDGVGPFAGHPSPLRVGRYHSLGVVEAPTGYHVHARADGLIMAMSDPVRRTIGWQFHPESILTGRGALLLESALAALEVAS
jgi:anthranilate synthase/aminodeoxychorismate synthase-like glutamine amidotransferase